MGMFDTFYHDEAEILCPNCKQKYDAVGGIQTKQFDNLLYEYFIGDVVSEINTPDEYYVAGDVWCDFCDHEITVIFGFKSSIFVGIFQNTVDAAEAAANFNIAENYKILFHQKTKYQHQSMMLKSYIKRTIAVHGTKPIKVAFNRLFDIHNSFIDYDIIKTLKNILDRSGED